MTSAATIRAVRATWLRALVVVGAVIAHAANAQTPAFERVAEPSAPPRQTSVDLGAGVVLTLDAGRLVTSNGTVVASTAAGGTGAVRAFALHPHGTLFVACERGLFVLDAAHVVLDAAELRDGVPPGSPCGVVVDDERRLWLCTTEAFGVVEPRFGFGRTLSAADGAPPPPYTGLSVAADGRLLVHAADGVFAYRKDVGPPPTLDAATGGVTLRMRRRNHHLLTPIGADGIRGLPPGRHAVEVFAFDRDLRATRVEERVVDVPYPKALDRRMLPLLAVGGVAVIFVACCVIARRRAGAGPWFGRAVATTAIVTVVGLQVLAAFLGYGRSWPFVGFSMYTENWHEGSVLHRPQLVALRADGSARELTTADAGIVQDGYWQVLAELLHGDDAARDAFLARIESLRRDPSGPFVGFALLDGRIRLTASGPVEVAPTVMVRHPVRGPR